MLNYDPKTDIINPKHCQICVQRLKEYKFDVIFPNRFADQSVEIQNIFLKFFANV